MENYKKQSNLGPTTSSITKHKKSATKSGASPTSAAWTSSLSTSAQPPGTIASRAWPGGRLVTCGATTGYDAKVDLRFLFSRQLSLLGSYMGTKSELHSVMPLVASGHLRPIVDRVFPLAEAAAAHSYLESSSQFGKVVLAV